MTLFVQKAPPSYEEHPQAIYTVRGLRQQYGQRTVLQIDTLDVQAGEFVAIVGPSGSGKSTLLRLLGLLEAPTYGQVAVHLNHHAYTHRTLSTEARRQLAMVFQKPYLLSRSVRANIAYGLRVRGKRDGNERIERIMERIAMSHLQDSRPWELSGGELQRVALARSLILEPRVLLLDEPTANLDPYNVRLIEGLLQEQREAHDTTIIMITHNIFQARRMADRVAFLLEGELVELAATAEFFDNPRDPRTASFLSGDLVY